MNSLSLLKGVHKTVHRRFASFTEASQIRETRRCAAFAIEQVKVFEEDKGNSRLMTRREFKNRSKVGKTFDEVAGRFADNFKSHWRIAKPAHESLCDHSCEDEDPAAGIYW
jgi:hypothetical protein